MHIAHGSAKAHKTNMHQWDGLQEDELDSGYPADIAGFSGIVRQEHADDGQDAEEECEDKPRCSKDNACNQQDHGRQRKQMPGRPERGRHRHSSNKPLS
jgi:hypothetical protein